MLHFFKFELIPISIEEQKDAFERELEKHESEIELIETEVK